MYLELPEDQGLVCALPARPPWPITVAATGGVRKRRALCVDKLKPACGQTNRRSPRGGKTRWSISHSVITQLRYLHFAVSLSKLIWTWKSKSRNYVSTQESQKRFFTWALHRRTETFNHEGVSSLRLEIQNGKKPIYLLILSDPEAKCWLIIAKCWDPSMAVLPEEAELLPSSDGCHSDPSWRRTPFCCARAVWHLTSPRPHCAPQELYLQQVVLSCTPWASREIHFNVPSKIIVAHNSSGVVAPEAAGWGVLRATFCGLPRSLPAKPSQRSIESN